MARPAKEGLGYFPFDVDFYEDFKIEDLSNEFGPLGESVYKRILCLVYRDKGYYLEIDMDKLAIKLIKSIGNRWVRSKDQVIQVILYCADIGLFDKDLLSRGVITSVGIQRRFLEAKGRRPAINDSYWFLDKKPSINSSQPPINEEITPIISEKPPVLPPDNSQSKVKKSKVKKSKVNICPELKNDSGPEDDFGKRIIAFTLNDKTEYPIFEKQVSGWEELYPAVDIIQELRKMKGWLDSNPKKRKTRRGTPSFITNWLSREQDRGGSINREIPRSRDNLEKEKADILMRKLREEDAQDAEIGNDAAPSKDS